MPVAGNLVKFKAGSYAAYQSLVSKDLSTVYFCTDKQRIFVGETEYTRPVLSGAGVPTKATVGVDNPVDTLYFDTTNVELYVTVGNGEWIKVTTRSELAALTDRVTTVEGKVANLENKTTETNTALGQLTERVTQAETDVDNAQKAADDARAIADQNVLDIDALEEKVDGLNLEALGGIDADDIAKWDKASTDATKALGDAAAAQSTADQGVADAAAAKTAADNAQDAADAAQSDATQALADAAAAQAQADKGVADAATAQAQADKGVADAAAAKKAADDAQADADKNAEDIAALGNNKADKTVVEGINGRLETAEGEIDDLQQQILGLTGAMHLVGIGAALPAVEDSNDGDVYIINAGDDAGKEFVFSNGAWHEFGDVSDYLTAASAAATYETKADATAKKNALDQAIADEASRADAAEKKNAEDIGKVAQDLADAEQTHATDKAALEKAISDEAARADAAEKANAKAIADQATADAATYETKTDASSKLAEAKKHADDLNTAMDERVDALEGASAEVDGKIATAKQEAINAAAADATSKANTAESNAKSYAESEAADALAEAKEYVDNNKLVWEEF